MSSEEFKVYEVKNLLQIEKVFFIFKWGFLKWNEKNLHIEKKVFFVFKRFFIKIWYIDTCILTYFFMERFLTEKAHIKYI